MHKYMELQALRLDREGEAPYARAHYKQRHPMKFPSLARAAGLAAAALLAVSAAGAQSSYPDKPMRIMVGALPAAAPTSWRACWPTSSRPRSSSTVVVENRPGASNTIAGELTARAPADGATLLLATNTAQAVAPHILKLKYDPLKDLQPVGLVAVMPNVLVVSASSPYKSVKDLVTAMAAQAGRLQVRLVGHRQHAARGRRGLQPGHRHEVDPRALQGRSSQAHIDIIAGEVDMMFDSTSSAMGQIKAGKFRALAVSAPQRSPELPDVPTLAEQGIKGADVSTWYGLYVTAGTPRPAVERLSAELTRTLKLADVQTRIKALGGEPARSPANPSRQ